MGGGGAFANLADIQFKETLPTDWKGTLDVENLPPKSTIPCKE